MERSRLGLVLIFLGAILFIISLFVFLLPSDLYLLSLITLFTSVILIAVGFAYTKDNVESSH